MAHRESEDAGTQVGRRERSTGRHVNGPQSETQMTALSITMPTPLPAAHLARRR
jgi:hypothetical protein